MSRQTSVKMTRHRLLALLHVILLALLPGVWSTKPESQSSSRRPSHAAASAHDDSTKDAIAARHAWAEQEDWIQRLMQKGWKNDYGRQRLMAMARANYKELPEWKLLPAKETLENTRTVIHGMIRWNPKSQQLELDMQMVGAAQGHRKSCDEDDPKRPSNKDFQRRLHLTVLNLALEVAEKWQSKGCPVHPALHQKTDQGGYLGTDSQSREARQTQLDRWAAQELQPGMQCTNPLFLRPFMRYGTLGPFAISRWPSLEKTEATRSRSSKPDS